jgi:hypothetical protein
MSIHARLAPIRDYRCPFTPVRTYSRLSMSIHARLVPIRDYRCPFTPVRTYSRLSMSIELTLSVNLCGNASDRARILSFLEDIDAELPAAYRWRNSISSFKAR